MENVGIYLFALIVLAWPAVTFFVASNIKTSQWASIDDYDYGTVRRTTNPSTTVAPTPPYVKSPTITPNADVHRRTM